jgi:hypothetical protein
VTQADVDDLLKAAMAGVGTAPAWWMYENRLTPEDIALGLEALRRRLRRMDWPSDLPKETP